MDTLVLVLNNVYIPNSYFYRSSLKWRSIKDASGFSLSYRHVHFEYKYIYNPISNRTYYYIMLTVSITKFLYGENFNILDTNDIDKFYSEINFLLRKIFASLRTNCKNSSLYNIKEWILNRIDIVSNIKCVDNYQKQVYLNIFKQLKYPYLKKKIYPTGIHDGNKSNVLNFYDKNEEISSKNSTNDCPENTLRLEIQIKKSKINYLVEKGYLRGNKLKDLFCNLDRLNELFFNYLKKFGLFKKFLSQTQMESFLLSIMQKNKISNTVYENMKASIIDKKPVSKNTSNKYIQILNQYNYSNIVIENPLVHKLNFSNFQLFKHDRFKKLSDHKLQILIYLYLLISPIKTIYNRPPQILSINLTRPLKLVKIYDDS